MESARNTTPMNGIGNLHPDKELPASILVVEDEPDLLEGIRKVLARHGHQVETCGDGSVAADLLRKQTFSVVILDLKLPGTPGLEVLQALKNINPDTEVIIITGYGDLDSAITALKLDASDFILKPFKNEALLVALTRALEKIEVKNTIRKYTGHLEDMVQSATEDIVRRREFQNKLIENSIDGIVATDAEDNIIISNQASEQFFGQPRAEIFRRINLRNTYPAHVYKEINQDLRCLISLEERTDPPEVDIAAKLSPEVPGRRAGEPAFESVGFFHDIRQLRELEKDLIQGEKLRAAGQTLAGMGQFLQNVLVTLRRSAHVIRTAMEKNDWRHSTTGLEILTHATDRLARLTEDFLALAEAEPEFRESDANEIARGVCMTLEAKAKEHGVALTFELDPDLPAVRLHPPGIIRALTHLVENAIEACPGHPKQEGKVTLKTSRESDTILFTVSDDGTGMDEETEKKLFTTAFTTKGALGTGAGLLIVQHIARAHRGGVAVSTGKGRGSTFVLRIPISIEE